jgi:membrane-associated phospholipid phosphatase
LTVALATTVASAVAASAPGVTRFEASVFRSMNALPAGLAPPLAVVMQLGSLGAVPSGAVVALLARRSTLAVDIAAAGGASWVLAKALKILVARERPGVLLQEVLLRGRAQRGLGFPSGHAAVATALVTTSSPWTASRARLALPLLGAAVGVARIYIGAHLPSDVVGGAALGYSLATAVMLRHPTSASLGEG